MWSMSKNMDITAGQNSAFGLFKRLIAGAIRVSRCEPARFTETAKECLWALLAKPGDRYVILKLFNPIPSVCQSSA